MCHGEAFDRAVAYWKSVASDPDAKYDDVVNYEGKDIEPTVTWGINPGQAVGISEKLPEPEEYSDPDGARKLTSIWDGNRARRYSARLSMSPSSALAQMAVADCARPQRSPKVERLSPEFAPW